MKFPPCQVQNVLSNDQLLSSLSGVLSNEEQSLIQWQIDVFDDDRCNQPRFRLQRQADKALYPASVCKLFYLVMTLHLAETSQLTLDAEDERALADMIQHSSNDATVYLFGRLTNTENGPLLDEVGMHNWWQKRLAVQRYFQSLQLPGYESCRLFHATYEFSPYGRENAVREHGRNALSPRVCNDLLLRLRQGQLLSDASRRRCWQLLNRDWERRLEHQNPVESQVLSFLAEGVRRDTTVWSKAGWTSDTRHDCVVLSRAGKTLIATVMSQGAELAENTRWLPVLGGLLDDTIAS